MAFPFLPGLFVGEFKDVFVTALTGPFTRINPDYCMIKNAIIGVFAYTHRGRLWLLKFAAK
jgi:hypothetical protein